MSGKDAGGLIREWADMIEAVRSWLFLAVLLFFVLLYAAVLLGWLRPLVGERWVTRVEPVVFLLFGYCLGRLPARRAEAAFRDAVNHQAQKTDATQHAKEQAQQARDVLEERAKNVRAILATTISSSASGPGGSAGRPGEDDLRRSVAAALNILDS